MKKKLIAALAVVGFGLSGMSVAAVAKTPGKPGVNPIAPGGNILDVATAAGAFKTLAAAIGCLTQPDGSNPIVAALTGDDKLTVFAPTDTAFQATLPGVTPANVCTKLDDATIANVLTYHVTYGRRFSNSVFNANNSKPIEMLNGEYIVANPDLTIADVAGQAVGVVPSLVNINATNGVIHVIDRVLLPFEP